MLPSVTEKMLKDADEMRAFYASVGLSPETTERAIQARFSAPADGDEAGLPMRGRKSRGRHLQKKHKK